VGYAKLVVGERPSQSAITPTTIPTSCSRPSSSTTSSRH